MTPGNRGFFRTLLQKIILFPILILLQSCYSLQQGWGQAKLLMSRQDLEDVLQKKTEPTERLRLLEMVPEILSFAEKEVGLKPGKSYRSYVPLKSDSVTYVVQAAERRALRKKTWWFPIIGTQPYLGYFDEADARKKFEELKKEGFDVKLGGVPAFSLLGYFPDPIYSSMLEGQELSDLAETLFHESLHLTVYIANFSSFNENLADFVAKRATERYLKEKLQSDQSLKKYQEKHRRSLEAQKIFQGFLKETLKSLESFYEAAKTRPELSSDESFLEQRNTVFDKIVSDYEEQVRPHVLGTGYEWAFKKGRINNAVLLGYSLYEADQKPFEKLYLRVGEQISDFVKAIKECFDGTSPKTEADVWSIVGSCRTPASAPPP